MENKTLEEKVAEDLTKSGFSAEMLALKIFKNEEWNTTGISTYFDLDEEKTRESDIKAHITKYERINNELVAQCFFQVVGEVKKTNKPWVIFKEIPHYDWVLGEKWDSLIFSHGLKKNKNELTKSLSKNSLSEKFGWLGNGIHEAFKSPDQPSRWYPALVSVCKAAEHALKANSRGTTNSDENKSTYPHIFFVKPLLIIDGVLMSAELNNENDIDVNKIDAATIKFGFQTNNYTRGSYTVDVVTLSFLDEYLRICKNRNENIYSSLIKHSDKNTA